MTEAVQFTVYGVPVPQGSSKAFIPKGWKRAVITTDNAKLKPWRQQVSGTALASMQGRARFERSVPIRVEADFYFEKPKSVKKSITAKVTKPDVDKTLRGLLDALTGIVFTDDSQVVSASVRKLFGSPARAEIRVAAQAAEATYVL